jgi:hypothetical protein
MAVSFKGTTIRRSPDGTSPAVAGMKKVKGMSGGGGSWATLTAILKAISRLHPGFRVLAAIAAICGVIGLALGVLGWMKPATETAKSTGKASQSMAFSYSAEVPRTAAYDGTTVYSPDPIFRKLANVVDLHMNYQGEPGRISVRARLSSPNGWHKTVELSQPRRFTTDRYTGKVQLDLASLEQLAINAGKAIGVDMGTITLAITAQVQHADGRAFEPQVSFNLAPQQFVPAGDLTTRKVDQATSGAMESVHDRQIGAFGYNVVTAAQARKYALLLLLAALISAGVIAAMALSRAPLKTRVQIQRRYPHLIVPVEPMASPPGKPVVTVDTFPALVKLAERYGQMILTWTRPDGADDFVVRDEGILYRYRIDPNIPPFKAVAAKPTPEPADRSQAVETGSETVPVMGLPPVPEPSPGAATDEGESTGTGGEAATTADEAATTVKPPVKKATPRKRATKTAAAKAAATKAAGTRTPAKRTRAATKPPHSPAESIEGSVTSPAPEAETQVEASAAGPEIRSDRPEVEVAIEVNQSAAKPTDTLPPVEQQDENLHDSGQRPDEPLAAITDTDASALSQRADDSHQAGDDATGIETTSEISATSEKDGTAGLTEAEASPTAQIDTPVEQGEQVDQEPPVIGEPTLAEAKAEHTPASSVELEQDLTSQKPPTAEAGEPKPEANQTASEPLAPLTAAEQTAAAPNKAAAEPDNPITEPNEATVKPSKSTTERDEAAAGRNELNAEPETASDQANAELPPSESTESEPAATDNLTPKPVTTTDQPRKAAKNQKRSSRRKSRSRRAPEPTVDEQQGAPTPVSPTAEAREAMEDLAGRNAPMTTPEPGSEPEPEPAARIEVKPVPWPEAGTKPRPTPPVHTRQPIYDFLPAAKRNVAEADEPDA